jgi:hypothetical protein
MATKRRHAAKPKTGYNPGKKVYVHGYKVTGHTRRMPGKARRK